MFVSDSLNIKNGHLTFGGADIVELAEKFGTPLYLFDENHIQSVCRGFNRAVGEFYDGHGTAAYASKAFLCVAMARLMAREGMSLDTVSGGEIYTAAKAGFPFDRIVFHGNNKSDAELAYAIELGVGRIVADGESDLDRINGLAGEYGRKVKVLLRITPGIDAHTHSFIRTGQIDSKFGVTLENGDALRAVEKALGLKNIDFAGVHCHIGSQIFETEPFVHTVNVMIDFICAVKDTFGVELAELDLGGGFGIRYTQDQPKTDYYEYIRVVCEAVKSRCTERSFKCPYLIFEPGRSIVGEAGITLYTVGRIKSIPGVRDYVSIDGGMTDNPRYALYQAPYEVCIANKADRERDYTATVAGKCCESGDLIQENCLMQKPERGDIMAVFSTGAYNYSMSSNYNRLCKPAVVFVNNGETRVVVKRETFEDLVRNDVTE